MKGQAGFSLLELTIVLVIIGFIVGAVMEGQQMLYNARMQKIVSDLESYGEAVVLYYDRYGMYPGDEDDGGFPSGDTLDGNHNGLIDAAEATNAWEDLADGMGLVRRNSPVRGGTYTFGFRTFFGTGNQNYIAVGNILNQMAESIDSRHDDGVYNTGNIHSSAAYDGSETLITLYRRL